MKSEILRGRAGLLTAESETQPKLVILSGGSHDVDTMCR